MSTICREEAKTVAKNASKTPYRLLSLPVVWPQALDRDLPGHAHMHITELYVVPQLRNKH